jgi:hypothetical protein
LSNSAKQKKSSLYQFKDFFLVNRLPRCVGQLKDTTHCWRRRLRHVSRHNALLTSLASHVEWNDERSVTLSRICICKVIQLLLIFRNNNFVCRSVQHWQRIYINLIVCTKSSYVSMNIVSIYFPLGDITFTPMQSDRLWCGQFTSTSYKEKFGGKSKQSTCRWQTSC